MVTKFNSEEGINQQVFLLRKPIFFFAYFTQNPLELPLCNENMNRIRAIKGRSFYSKNIFWTYALWIV